MQEFSKFKKMGKIALYAIFASFLVLSILALVLSSGEGVEGLASKLSLLFFGGFALLGLAFLVLGFFLLKGLEKLEEVKTEEANNVDEGL